MDENIRPAWITGDLVDQAVSILRDKGLVASSENDAVGILLTLGQILEFMGMLDCEDEN